MAAREYRLGVAPVRMKRTGRGCSAASVGVQGWGPFEGGGGSALLLPAPPRPYLDTLSGIAQLIAVKQSRPGKPGIWDLGSGIWNQHRLSSAWRWCRTQSARRVARPRQRLPYSSEAWGHSEVSLEQGDSRPTLPGREVGLELEPHVRNQAIGGLFGSRREGPRSASVGMIFRICNHQYSQMPTSEDRPRPYN